MRAAAAGRGARPSITSDALVASALAGELSDDDAQRPSRKAATPSQALALRARARRNSRER